MWIIEKLSISFSSSSIHSFVERICRIGDYPLPTFDCREQLKTQVFAGGHRFMGSSQAGTLGYTINYYGYIYMGKLERPHCDLTGIMVSKGKYPQIALIQVSEIL